MLASWKRRARQLKTEIYAIALCVKDPRLPLHARVLAVFIVAYAFSPIDLIPDPIPILGYLDDLILLPLAIWLLLKIIPASLLDDCCAQVNAADFQERPTNWIAAAVIIALWIAAFVFIVNLIT
jgi:uncharacterized membrane protein YkvA (DUF1232 family)